MASVQFSKLTFAPTLSILEIYEVLVIYEALGETNDSTALLAEYNRKHASEIKSEGSGMKRTNKKFIQDFIRKQQKQRRGAQSVNMEDSQRLKQMRSELQKPSVGHALLTQPEQPPQAKTKPTFAHALSAEISLLQDVSLGSGKMGQFIVVSF